MPPQVAMKITEEALNLISEFTGQSTDVLGDEVYILFSILSVDPLEFNAKFLTEEQIFEVVKTDEDVHILSM